MSTSGEYHKLESQPLTLVLAEFRFSKVLKMADYVPDIQEKLRSMYPLFEEKNEQSIDVNNEGVRLGSVISNWIFSSADHTKSVLINQDRLVFFSTVYERFQGFHKDCMDVFRVVEDIASPSLILRVGLRYNDSIVPDDGDTLDQYIEEPWLPPDLLVKRHGDLHYHKEETVINTTFGTLSIRTLIGKMNLKVMPDLASVSPVKINHSAPLDKLTAVLDFDHCWEAGDNSVGFDLEFSDKMLSDLHAGARDAFWQTTSDTARSVRWK